MNKLPSISNPHKKPKINIDIDKVVPVKKSLYRSRIQPKTVRKRECTINYFQKSPEKMMKKTSSVVFKSFESPNPVSKLYDLESIRDLPSMKVSSFQRPSFQTPRVETTHFTISESTGIVCNSQMHSLNIPSTQWALLSSSTPLAGLRGYSIVSYRGNLIKYGGYSSYKGAKSFSKSLNIYNIKENTWNAVEEVGEQQPSSRFNHCAAKLGKHMIVFGGSDGHHALNDLHTFNLQQLFWIKHEISNPTRRSQASLVPVVDESLKRNNAMSLYYMTENKCFFAFQNAGIYLFGGLDEDVPKNDVYRLVGNAGALSWELVNTKGTKKPAPRYAHTAASVRSFMYVFGGADAQGLTVRDLFVLNVIDFRWNEVSISGQAPVYRVGSCMQEYKNRIFIFGGSSGKYEVYALETDFRLVNKHSN